MSGPRRCGPVSPCGLARRFTTRPATWPRSSPGLAAAPTERCRRLRVTLERPPAQTRTLTDLPPVRDRDLASLVANQAGRFFRRNGTALVTDATWVTNE